jgi:hypothetical protein
VKKEKKRKGNKKTYRKKGGRTKEKNCKELK